MLCPYLPNPHKARLTKIGICVTFLVSRNPPTYGGIPMVAVAYKQFPKDMNARKLEDELEKLQRFMEDALAKSDGVHELFSLMKHMEQTLFRTRIALAEALYKDERYLQAVQQLKLACQFDAHTPEIRVLLELLHQVAPNAVNTAFDRDALVHGL